MQKDELTQKPLENRYIQYLRTIHDIIWNLSDENFKNSINLLMNLFDTQLPFSFNLVTSQLIYSSFISQMKNFGIYLHFMKAIEIKEEEINKNINKIIEIFAKFLNGLNTKESYYLLEVMIEQCLIDPKKFSYVTHYPTKEEISNSIIKDPFCQQFYETTKEVSKNDWELHKKYVSEGINPNALAKIIRNDEIEKLQEISSQENFDFNQTIKPSLYEKCSFINEKNVTLIDYAAFFGSVQCFNFLLRNGANVTNTGKYAIAGGNLEIFHLCEQNHINFEDVYEIAIEFQRNDIFHYLYENKFIEINDINKLGRKCITHNNYEILSFLENENMKIDDSIINESAKVGNIFLLKHFLEKYQIPKNVLAYSIELGNIEIVKYILKQKGFDINAKNDI